MNQWYCISVQDCNMLCYSPAGHSCMYLLFRNAPGRKQVYIQESVCKQEVTYSSVEECAISHYKSEGYTEGN